MMLSGYGELTTSLAEPRRALQAFAPISLLVLLVALLVHPSHAIEASLCDEDGVSETPGFALGRDSNQCLLLDPGNRDAPVRFQWEIFHKKGISDSATTSLPSGVDSIDLRRGSECGGGSQGCSFLVWDTVIDNYLSPAAKNQDVLFWGTGARVQYMLIKDSVIANGWKCGSGSWSGPNGLRCASSEDSSAHSDGMQLRGQPVLDGWFILQDTDFVNGVNLHFLSQVSSEVGRTGSLVFQGGEVGRRQSIGAARSWVDDCEARSSSDNSNASDICPRGRTLIDSPNREIWFIDVHGETTFAPKGNHEKIVVVQESGCGTNGCGNGSIQYHNGWPHPLDTSTSDGPGRCPNGKLGAFRSTVAYCYTSLEEAARDHKLPPFVQLSASGWKDPQGGSARPAAPELLP